MGLAITQSQTFSIQIQKKESIIQFFVINMNIKSNAFTSKY